MSDSKRLLSLDAFRGLTIAGMILVNTPGSWSYVFGPLRHAEWSGCTPTDLVFPFFLYIVGVSMWFSFKKFDHQWSGDVALKILKRAGMIFLIGLLLNFFPFFNRSIADLRIMGVLQRIAVAFLGGSVICMISPKKWLPYIAAFILLGYWFLMNQFGGDDPYSLEGNLARKIDLMVFGDNHVYHGFGIAFDPEGLVSSIPAIGTVIIGYLIGSFVDEKRSDSNFIYNMIAIGALLATLGLVWHLKFPINKPLWTSSYVLYTAGIATLLLSIFVFMIDLKGWKKWAKPFVVFGVNPLFSFALSVLWVKILIFILRSQDGEKITTGYSWLYQNIFVPLAGNMNGSLLFALFHVGMFWMVAYVLYKRNIFIKV